MQARKDLPPYCKRAAAEHRITVITVMIDIALEGYQCWDARRLTALVGRKVVNECVAKRLTENFREMTVVRNEKNIE